MLTLFDHSKQLCGMVISTGSIALTKQYVVLLRVHSEHLEFNLE